MGKILRLQSNRLDCIRSNIQSKCSYRHTYKSNKVLEESTISLKYFTAYYYNAHLEDMSVEL